MFEPRLLRWLVALFVFVLLASCREAPPVFTPLPSGAVVLVVGDSLVAGTGASRDAAWPEVMAQRSGWEVVNAGVPGDTSAGVRARLLALIEDHRPDAVIIAIGGNDFLRNVPLEETRANLDAIVRESRAASRHVAVVAIPAVSTSYARGTWLFFMMELLREQMYRHHHVRHEPSQVGANGIAGYVAPESAFAFRRNARPH